MTLTIWTYDWVPQGPRGHVRDIRLRWACEEAGLPYTIRSVGFGAILEPDRADAVGEARFLAGPAETDVADMAAGWRRDPIVGPDHERVGHGTSPSGEGSG